MPILRASRSAVCVVCCGVVMCGVGAGVGVQCVVCVLGSVLCRWCAVCGGCVARRLFCRHTRMRFEPTHGDVLSIHTGRRERGRGGGGGGGGSPLPLSSLLSFSSLLSLLTSRSCRLSLSSLSNNDNDHSSSRSLSLCAHTALICQRVRVPVLWLIPCLAELVRIKKLCKPRATWNEVGRPVLEMGDVSVFVCVCLCLCLCLFVFVRDWLCLFVFGCV